MENIFIELLPPWVETGLQPAFYDLDSGTVLQQTARMYAKVNELTGHVNEYTEKFTELYNYVHDYFDNLDVQEEVNNKLDEMAEDGVLTDIIAQYLTLAGVLAYSTVSDLAAAENVAVGSKAKTFGYKRLGDGVYDIYVIRESLNTDVEDGYNIVPITSTANLVAERQQYGKKLVIEIKSTDNIQDYLDLPAEKTIILTENYTATSNLNINSDTTLDLNGKTLTVNTGGETLIFCYGLTDTSTGYNGKKNIIIRNGTISKACICLMHNKNVSIENVEFTTLNSRHAIQIAGSYDVTIKGCIFNGSIDYDANSCELINIDPCNHGGQPWMDEASVMYDHTANQNIYVLNNTFKAGDGANRYTNAVGSHGYDDTATNVYCKHMIIKGNNFGSPYTSCINTSVWEDVTVEDNTATFATSGVNTPTYAIKMRGGIDGFTIKGNQFTNPNYFIYSGEDLGYTKNNISVIDNKVTTNDTTTYRAINWYNVKNSLIKGNVIRYKQNALFMSGLSENGSPVADTECDGIDIVDNIFDKTDSTANQCLRLNRCKNINAINNEFPYTTLSSPAGNAFQITNDATLVRIENNRIKFSKNLVTSGGYHTDVFFKGNNTMFEEVTGINTTSSSGTFTVPLTYFGELVFQMGDSSHVSYVSIKPWLTSVNPIKFDTTSRTYTIPVVKTDSTIGVLQFSITDNATKYSFTSDLAVRAIYALD